MMKKGVLTTTLLFGLISGCLGPGAQVRPEVKPVTTVVETGDGSPVSISLKNEEFGYGTMWKVIVMGFAFLGLIGLDCWLCKRFRRVGKCK